MSYRWDTICNGRMDGAILICRSDEQNGLQGYK